MNSKVAFVLIISSIISLGFSNLESVKSQATGDIYIRANGGIDPPSAPIQRIGEVYTFTSDLNHALRVEKDNIIINAASYASGGNTALQANGTFYNYTLYGIELFGRTNVTLKAMTGFLWLANTSNCIIYGCNGDIRIDDSSNNSVVSSNITGSQGLMLMNSQNNHIYGNNIHPAPNYANHTSPTITLLSSNNNAIYENNIEGSSTTGLYLSGAINNTMIRNNFIGNKEQVGGWDSYQNIWDNGTIGNYWSDLPSGGVYSIKIHFMIGNSIKTDYDNHAQPQPFSILTYPMPTPLHIEITNSPNPVPSSTPSPAQSLTPSPSIPEFPSWVILPLAMILILMSFFALEVKRKF